MLVVPVPLHRSKYAERGFNQARALAVHALGFCASLIPVAAHAGFEHADAAARH
jgi:predicted amidophosphoribosyltransferase